MHAASLSSVGTANSVNNPLHHPQHHHNVQQSLEPLHRQPLSLRQPPRRHPQCSRPSNAADPNNAVTRSNGNNPQPLLRHRNVQPSLEPSRRQPLNLHLPPRRHPQCSRPSNAADPNNAVTLSNGNNP